MRSKQRTRSRGLGLLHKTPVTYPGETKRMLSERFTEHIHDQGTNNANHASSSTSVTPNVRILLNRHEKSHPLNLILEHPAKEEKFF